ncbi:UbiA family prenyltransferase [Paraburkholderia sp. GAS448]|uniref:UbiA family prenyltransferase n=1 Tax=Paraburkholderia sp. GAS448 TaxID=3035136 RepID=UPI003D1B82BF
MANRSRAVLFVPLLTAFSFFDTGKLATLTMAFVSMSLGASATYIANDLWDLDSDRRHPRKRQRPFASGALSISNGILCAMALLIASLSLAFSTSPAFAAMLLLYLILTTAYSLFLKTRVMIDVITLSLLYTLRIFAGSVAVNISTSHWLLAFSVLTFLSLALVKRCAELVSLRRSADAVTVGRDYRVADLEVLWPLGIGSSLAAVIVFGLFINAPETAERYAILHSVPDEFWTPVVAITYHLAYLAVVLSTVFALWFVYKLARMRGLTFGQAVGFVVGFSLIYPLTFQQGGYYYDFIELLGVFGACYFLLKRWMIACTIFVALFSFNKETFFLVPLALIFLHEGDVAMSKRIGWLVIQLACCALSRHIILGGYEDNAGGLVEFHVLDNLRFWLNPKSYFGFYNLIAKGVFTPSLQNPLMLVPLIVFFRHAWRESGTRYRWYFFAAFLPVLVLFAFFGYRDETRNFSIVFPAIVLIALNGARQFGQIFSDADSEGKHTAARVDSSVGA